MELEEYIDTIYSPLKGKQVNSHNTCTTRHDDTGPWNRFKEWYLYALHALASASLALIMLVLIDEHDFSTGSRTAYPHSTLFLQTEVNGLVSVALVLVRFIAGSAATLLTWRWAFVLLEKCGITLAELLRLVDMRVPFRPRFESGYQLWWSALTVLVMVLSWPPSLAAPLANSSMGWVPGRRLVGTEREVNVRSVGGEQGDWGGFKEQQQTNVFTMMRTNAMLMRDPDYAFNKTTLPLQRYFSSTSNFTIGSKVKLTVPYFDVARIRWIDAQDRFKEASNTEIVSLTGIKFSNRVDGSVALYRDQPYNMSATPVPPTALLFNDTQYVYIKTGTIEAKEGKTRTSPCPTNTNGLGALPAVEQQKISNFYWGKWGADDCFIVGEAHVLAGQYAADNCTITAYSDNMATATCYVDDNNDSAARPTPDLRTNLTLESMSETLRNMMPLDVGGPYKALGLDEYTKGMLRIAYHASWSSLTETIGGATQIAQIDVAESVVRARVHRPRLYAWLCMNLSLLVSAVIVGFVRRSSRTKTVRDAGLAALTVDLSDVVHGVGVDGLCGAVALRGKDRSLPRMVWKGVDGVGGVGGDEGWCERKVVFVDERRVLVE